MANTSYQSKSKNKPTGQLPKQVRDKMEADRLALINKAKLIKARKEDEAASSTPLKRMGSYLKPGTKPDRDRKAQANRAKSQGGRSFAQTGTTKAGSTLARAAKTKRDITAKITAAEKKQSKDPRGNQVKATPGAAKKKTPAKKYNVGVSKGGVPFKEAFKYYSGLGQKTFTWNGKSYTTEKAKPKKAAPKRKPTGMSTGNTVAGSSSPKKTTKKKPSNAPNVGLGKMKTLGGLPVGAKPFKGSYNSKTHKLQNIKGKTYVVPKGK